jgi:hypothetical protein
MEKQLIQTEIENRISKLNYSDLTELMGYLKHVEEVKSLTSTKQIAMNEIQAAIKKGYTF